MNNPITLSDGHVSAETMYRWTGIDRTGRHHTGATSESPTVFVEDKFRRRWRGLLVCTGERTVGAVVPAVVNGGRRTWWAES